MYSLKVKHYSGFLMYHFHTLLCGLTPTFPNSMLFILPLLTLWKWKRSTYILPRLLFLLPFCQWEVSTLQHANPAHLFLLLCMNKSQYVHSLVTDHLEVYLFWLFPIISMMSIHIFLECISHGGFTVRLHIGVIYKVRMLDFISDCQWFCSVAFIIYTPTLAINSSHGYPSSSVFTHSCFPF